MSVLYVYAIARAAVTPDCDAIDGSRHFGALPSSGLAAIYTPVSAEEFSQEVIDSRAGDLDWLGAVGYHHQNVMAELMKQTAIIPLRAFTMFSNETALRGYLEEQGERLARMLARLDGKQEWTLRIEFDPQRWSDSLVRRIEPLRALAAEIESAAAGKAFLLRKKLDDERRKASREAEQQVVSEIERAVLDKLACQTVAETRQQRDGAFPQLNVLINRDEESTLQELHALLAGRYGDEGVTLAISGPWPPYTFAMMN